jgi:hypothetical protein
MKSSVNLKLRLAGAFAVLAIMAVAVSCKGFFVDPTLTGLTVGPSGLTLSVNQQFQMVATGTYNDGTTKTLTSGVVWSSSDTGAVTIGQNSGLATGVAPGSSTITASSGGCASCTGTTSVTVALSGITAITVSPSSQTITIGASPGLCTASATTGSGNVDITNPSSGTTWTVQDASGNNVTSSFTLTFVSPNEQFTPSATLTPATYTVVASYPNTTFVGKATLVVQ